MEGKTKFVTKSDLKQMGTRLFLNNSAPDSKGYYKSYWTLVNGDVVYTVQNIHI